MPQRAYLPLSVSLGLRSLTDEQRNALCELPPAASPATPPPPLGPSGGSLGAFTADHPLLVSLRNLRRWYALDGMGEWLHELRLFSLKMNGYSLDQGRALIESNHARLVAAGVLPKD